MQIYKELSLIEAKRLCLRVHEQNVCLDSGYRGYRTKIEQTRYVRLVVRNLLA